MMKADVIREKFLKFFESKGHKIFYSDSLVPQDDPTLLFTGAGMNQFKDYFLGIKRDCKRAASSQKCFRTGDIDNVGKTPGHHTFFEMLGNFSFGDYFKEEAIEWAWEFLTKDLKIKTQNLWVSVYKDDGEAYGIWLKTIKVPEEKIVKLGDKDNFWPSMAVAKGPNGPCGPCSEIFFDQGLDAGCGKPGCSPACGCSRFVEVWNLVFTQYNRKDGGVLEPLPKKNIDTGMGLERIAAVMQGVRSNFETDLFAPIVKDVRFFIAFPLTLPLSPVGRGVKGEGVRNDAAIYTIVDHIRAAAFLITDGVLPSNEGRGYVERMVLRRAMRCGKQLGVEKPFLYKLIPAVASAMKKQYPQIETRRENISQIILMEEEKFSQTLQEGMQILESLMASSKSKIIKGEDIFKLYDTYGFPLDLTEEIAQAKGFEVDKAGFEKAMTLQRESSRKASVISADIFAATLSQKIKKIAGQTEFLGYEKFTVDAKVVAILKDGKPQDHAAQTEDIWVILDRTSFYAESGGQVGDTGKITGQSTILEVADTKIFDKVIVHICRVQKGTIKVGDKVKAEVDKQRRLDIAKNHTATHLLQSALRKVLGGHVHQSGSMVAQDKLRFDFTHFKALSKEQIERVEELVNANIQADDKVSVKAMPLKEAVNSGAMALFDEKYEDTVRVVSIGGYSKELCGGTHLEKTGPIGMFKITSESSISAGTRRIEAATGKAASDISRNQQNILKDISAMFDAQPEDVLEKIESLLDRVKKLEASLEKAKRQMADSQMQELILKSKKIGDITLIISSVPDTDAELLRIMTDKIRNKIKSAAILLASSSAGKVSLVLAFSQDLVKKGFNAGALIKDVSRIVGGSGGGRPDMAQAGGNDPRKLKEAFVRFEELLRNSAG
jgi:alanyl-tRNA synthetase